LTLRGVAGPLTHLCMDSLSSWYLSRLAWSRRRLLTRLCVGSLFLRYPLCLAWSRRGLLTYLYVGSLFLQYPSSLAWSHHGLLTHLCVGSLFLWRLVVAALVTGREVGLWREIICDFSQLRSVLQTICTPPTVPPLWGFHLSRYRQKVKARHQRNRNSERPYRKTHDNLSSPLAEIKAFCGYIMKETCGGKKLR